MNLRRLSLLALLLIVAVMAIDVLALGLARSFERTVGDPGTVDFIQYWSAFQLLIEGRNPYDGAAMHVVQAAVGQSPNFTTLMWNPPWTPVVLAPILSLPFSAAAISWLLLSCGCLVVIILALPGALGVAAPPLIVRGLAVLVLYPIAENLVLGQLAIFLTTVLVVVLHCRAHQRYLLAGLSAALLTIKPHLFFLLVVPVAISLVYAPRRVVIRSSGGFFLGCLLLLGATLSIAPDSITWWIEAFTSAPRGPGAVSTAEWKTATLVTVLRDLLADPNGAAPHWPIVVLPIVALIGTVVLVLRSPLPLSWSHLTPPLLCLSLLLGPYGWLYDQTLLVVCQGDIVSRWWWNRRDPRLIIGLCGLVCIELVALYLGTVTDAALDDFMWLPLAMLTAWGITAPRSRATAHSPASAPF